MYRSHLKESASPRRKETSLKVYHSAQQISSTTDGIRISTWKLKAYYLLIGCKLKATSPLTERGLFGYFINKPK
jgi:hypothetical protein